MDQHELIGMARDYAGRSEMNRVSEQAAPREDIVGMRMYEAPIFGFASANDPMFHELRKENVVGSHLLLPEQWLPGAKTVIAMFLPATQRVIDSNAADLSEPSAEWLCARIEGHRFIGSLCAALAQALTEAGHPSVVPVQDARSWSNTNKPGKPAFTSNWSERHAACVCGLGTFGLSRGLITKKGMAGRLATLVTTLGIEPTRRAYSNYNEYCTMCGACARNCPAGAISLENGKDQALCSAFLDKTMEKYRPRYGCGKCQVGVPCSTGLPGPSLPF